MKKHNTPTLVVIFGGAGELTRTKLADSLYDLYRRELLPDIFRIVGFSRDDYNTETYKEFIKEAIQKKHHNNIGHVNAFLDHVSYKQGDFSEAKAYSGLENALDALDAEIGMCTNKLFYLAVPPATYDMIFDNLAESKLAEPCSEETGWTRILVEKPFGNDTKTAQELDMKLGRLFQEEQIFRIDHYLAKDAIENLLTFRFSNTLFEQTWNRDAVEKVHIKLYEDMGVEQRARFYNATGAFRDVGQNHMLQMLALIAMDNPLKLDAKHLRRERTKILESIKTYDLEEVKTNTLRAQYEGFKDILDVGDESQTETFFLTKVLIENKRWHDVPFYLESGKFMNERKAEIIVYFKPTVPCMCPKSDPHEHQNAIRIEFHPKQCINVDFWVKSPGIGFGVEQQQMSFCYDDDTDAPDAYEKVLYDSIQGDQTSFVSTAEVAAAWNFITPILEHWKGTPMYTYKKGSAGPVEKENLFT